VDTDFSFEKYAAQFIPSMIDVFKQSFPQDTDLLANDRIGFNNLFNFIYESLTTIYSYRPQLAGKIATQITRLVEEERLYFDATVEIDHLNAIADNIKLLMNTIGQENRQFEQYEAAVHAINDSFTYYMSMGGAFNWKDSRGLVARSPQLLDKFAVYIENSTPENKQKLFDLYAQSITNKLTSDTLADVNITTITGIFDVAARLNLPRETSIKKIVTILDNSITTRPSDMVTRAVINVMRNDEIATYVNRNRQFINKVAPHFAQLIAVTSPLSEFGKMYPKIAKLKFSQKYVLGDVRRQIYHDLKAQSNNDLVPRRRELAFDNIQMIRDQFGRSFMVPASVTNIQKMISLRGGGYSASDFQQMLPNFAMLINAGFMPQHLFINFGERDAFNVEQLIRNKGFKLTGRTLIKGELNGKPVGITGTGVMYCVADGRFRMTSSFAELQQLQQEALFDHHKQKPKHGIYNLYERVAATRSK
jgi:hypothetical protein